MKALDVGSGSGYLTACMAMMVGEQGQVFLISSRDSKRFLFVLKVYLGLQRRTSSKTMSFDRSPKACHTVCSSKKKVRFSQAETTTLDKNGSSSFYR
jgi:hypothetical protein